MNAMPLHAHHPSRQDILKVDALGVLSEFAGDLVGIDDVEALLWAVAERTISRGVGRLSLSQDHTGTS